MKTPPFFRERARARARARFVPKDELDYLDNLDYLDELDELDDLDMSYRPVLITHYSSLITHHCL